MGLTMGERRSVSREIAQRYRKRDRRGKRLALDEFCLTTGYHRKYAIHLLAHGVHRTLTKLFLSPVAALCSQLQTWPRDISERGSPSKSLSLFTRVTVDSAREGLQRKS